MRMRMRGGVAVACGPCILAKIGIHLDFIHTYTYITYNLASIALHSISQLEKWKRTKQDVWDFKDQKKPCLAWWCTGQYSARRIDRSIFQPYMYIYTYLCT